MTFAEADRRFSDYMVSGLLMMPKDATYTEARDAILAAAAARDTEDLMVLANAFALRGAGTGAVSPDRESADLTGVTESYQTSGDVQIVKAEIVSDSDCDNDGQLDGSESGTLIVTVRNGGPVVLDNTMVHVADTRGLSFPKGQELAIPRLGPFESATVEVPMKIAELKGMQALFLGFQAHNDASAHQVVSSAITRRINFNSRPQNSKTDDVESPLVVWNIRSVGDDTYSWTRKQVGAPNTLWFAPNPSSATDKSLESPVLNVGSEPFSIRFEHRYGFESSVDEQGVVTNWDGAVIEMSLDGGVVWNDITETGVDPGYQGVLTDQGQLPLAGRKGLVGVSQGYPEMMATTLNFGTKLAKRSVKIRFRSASDGAVGAQGWEIDNLRFTGILNSPFATIENDDSNCRVGPAPGGEEGEPKKDEGGCATGGAGGSMAGLVFALGALLATRRKRVS